MESRGGDSTVHSKEEITKKASAPAAQDGIDSNAMKEQSSSSSASKTLSVPKFHSLIKMRQKLLKRIQQLEEREVSFSDEEKEIFYINHERKLKKALVDIEKTLYKHGALLDIDENLQAFYNNTASVEISIMDTGNELLNQRLTKLISRKSLDKEKTITPSFEELRDIMCELRAEQGPSSGIPDPDLESEAFCYRLVDRLENIAFVTARSHQNFISSQLLENIDFYVPEQDRPHCSNLPKVGSDMEKFLSACEISQCMPDEVFRMEMKTAGKLELADIQESHNADDGIDLAIDGDSGSDEEEDMEDEELERNESESPLSRSSELYPASEIVDDLQLSSAFVEMPTFSATFGLKQPDQNMDACIVLPKGACESATSVFTGKWNDSETPDQRKAVKRVSDWLQNVEPGKVALVEIPSDDESRIKEIGGRGIKRELLNAENHLDGENPLDLNDDGEIVCLGVFQRSPGSRGLVNTCKRRSHVYKHIKQTVSSSQPAGVICIDD